MKHLLSTAIILLCAAALTACAQTSKSKNMEKETDKKVLVAFFSRTGENYSVGRITKGNTHIVAEMIADRTGGELFEISPVKAYPDGYDRCTEVAQEEKQANARPAIKADHATDGYDIIFIGYPNWWGDMPMPVYTWIEKHTWEGKAVIPFCTHEGSGLGSTPAALAAACSGAKTLEGFECYGHVAQKQSDKARKAVESWLERIGF